VQAAHAAQAAEAGAHAAPVGHHDRACVAGHHVGDGAAPIDQHADLATDLPGELAQLAGQLLAHEALGREPPTPEALDDSDTAVFVPDAEPPPQPVDPEVLRPPPGAATVRPSVRDRRPSGAVDPDLLSKAASGARVIETGGATSFEITFADDVFANLVCQLTFDEGRLVALFRVPDHNLRRLLEAEAGRLRVQLEGRGLKVEEVKVEVA